MNAADERFGKAIEALATHAADYKALKRLIVELAWGNLLRWDEEVYGHPDLAGPREETGCDKGYELRGREHHDTIGQLMKLAARQDPRAPPGVVGRQLVIEDPRELCNTVTGWFLGQETVRTTVHDEPAFPRWIWDDLCKDLAAEASILLEQNELDIVALGGGSGDFVGRAEAGETTANNDDPFHGAPQK